MMAGTIVIVIKVSFHWTAKATMKAVTKVATPWTRGGSVKDCF